jgi:hypothetical protein
MNFPVHWRSMPVVIPAIPAITARVSATPALQYPNIFSIVRLAPVKKPGKHPIPFVHDYWEEVYLVSGDLTVGNDAHGKGGTPFEPNTYAYRPSYGPFKSESCMLLEIHYFDPA